MISAHEGGLLAARMCAKHLTNACKTRINCDDFNIRSGSYGN